MKIAITGKGGVGKTFIAGSIATQFATRGYPVIAIDADPSPNLGLSLGLNWEELGRIIPIAENEKLIRLKTGTGYSGVFRLTFTVDDIIQNHAVMTPAGPNLMVMGTVRAMGSGCTCPAHSVVKALLRHLIVERNEIVILDMEAGIEHLGRGTAEHVDVMLIISDANRKSLETARTINAMASGSSVRKVGLIGNRIAGSDQETAIRVFTGRNHIPIFALVPFDTAVENSGITGEKLEEGHSPALKAVAELVDRLLAGLPATDNP